MAAVVTSGLFTVIAALCVFWLAVRWGASDEAALFAAAAYGVASPAWAYATLFMGHGQTAGCLMIAFVAADRLGDFAEAPDTRRRMGWVIGLAGGWAVVTEFQAAIPAVFIGLLRPTQSARRLRHPRRRPHRGWRGDRGAAAARVQHLAFGSPLHIGYASEEGFKELHTGFFGITYPRISTIGELLFGSYRGLLPLSPLMGIVPLGLVLVLGAAAAPDPRWWPRRSAFTTCCSTRRISTGRVAGRSVRAR